MYDRAFVSQLLFNTKRQKNERKSDIIISVKFAPAICDVSVSHFQNIFQTLTVLHYDAINVEF